MDRGTNREAAINRRFNAAQRRNAIARQVFDNQELVVRLIVDQAGGNAPVTAELRNDLDGTIAWVYVEPGVYRGTLADGFPERSVISESKIIDIALGTGYTVRKDTDGTILLQTGIILGPTQDDLLTDEIIEFKVANPLES